MSRHYGQIALLDSSRHTGGASAAFRSAPHAAPAGGATWPMIHVHLLRLLDDPRRALGLALSGLIFAAVTLLAFWSLYPAQNLLHVQTAPRSHLAEPSRADLDRTAAMEAGPDVRTAKMSKAAVAATPKLQRSSVLASEAARLRNRYASVEGQFRNQMLEENVPGAAYLAAAVVPLHPADSGPIRSALFVLLGLISLAAVTAGIARKRNRRVYIASDVEHVLGFAPMAQLPDFAEVPEEVTEEYLLQLAAKIESVSKRRSLRNCVFTGTGHGSGVTAIATRMKELLQPLGWAAVVVDAGGLSPAAPEGGLGAGEDATQHVAQTVEGRPAELVLADAAPLMVSAQTEDLVRHADCTIVVIESGVTTRAQLRAAAAILQRLNAQDVGFVLNRVRLAKADPDFRDSVQEMKRNLHDENSPSDQRMLRTLRFAIESGRASLEPEFAIAGQAAAYPGTKAMPPAAGAGQAIQVAVAEPEPAEEPSVSSLQQESQPPPRDAAQPPGEIPWWLIENPARSYTALNRPRPPRTDAWQPAFSASGGSELAQETAKPEMEPSPHVKLPRLSELRGMHFSGGLKELDLARHPEPPSTETELLMNAIAPFEPRIDQMAPTQSAASSPVPQARPDIAVPVRTFIPVPEPGVVPAATNGALSQADGSRSVTAQPRFLPPKRATVANNRAQRADNGHAARRGKSSVKEEQGQALDEVQILPSRRGQYKKKA